MEQRGLDGDQRAAERRLLAEPAGLGRARRFSIARHLTGAPPMVAWPTRCRGSTICQLCLHTPEMASAETIPDWGMSGVRPRTVLLLSLPGAARRASIGR